MATRHFDFKAFYLALDAKQRRAFARRAGTTQRYLIAHVAPRKKIPRPALMERLAAACGHFGQPVDAARLAGWFQEGAR